MQPDPAILIGRQEFAHDIPILTSRDDPGT